MTKPTDHPVRVRIAPSPTGDPHVGTAYIALFNLCFARKTGGRFILRIEDTDQARSTPESEAAIFRALRWLGLDYDEGPDVGGPHGAYRQSERAEIYARETKKLLDSGHAYHCFCTADRLAELRAGQKARKEQLRYDRHCRNLSADEVRKRIAAGEPFVIRLAVPLAGETTFRDRLRGDITFQNETIDDQVLLKSDGLPTYHLANVVDDHLMEITHVCRAEEWITSTPKHVLLYNAFGWEMPEFIHMPLLRNSDRSKISKRKNPTSLEWYRAEGFLPEALLNFLGLMGYSMSDGREVFTLQEMVESFSWDRVTTTGPVFDLEKLDWLNGSYIRSLQPAAFVGRLITGGFLPAEATKEKLLAIAPMVQERTKRLAEVRDLTAFFWAELPYEPADLLPKKKGEPVHTPPETRQLLEQCQTIFKEIAEWSAATLEHAMRGFGEGSDWKPQDLFMTLRVAITGRTVSTPLFETMQVLGRAESLKRLAHAIAKLA
jgi:glutamyl-tRNA synthetase